MAGSQCSESGAWGQDCCEYHIFFLTFDIYHFYRKRAGNFVFKKREKQFDSVTVISWRRVPLLVTLCKGVECVFVCMYGVCIHTDVLTELRLAV